MKNIEHYKQYFTKVKNDLEITLGTDKKATIKDFYKLRGEYIVKYSAPKNIFTSCFSF